MRKRLAPPESREFEDRQAAKTYYLDPEIRLIHTQNFNFSINFAALVPTPSNQDARIGVVLDGILYRLSQ